MKAIEETKNDVIKKEIIALERSRRFYEEDISRLIEVVSEEKEYLSFLDQYAIKQDYKGDSESERVKSMILEKGGLPTELYNEPDKPEYQLNI